MSSAKAMAARLGGAVMSLVLAACVTHGPAKAGDASAKIAHGKKLFQSYACGSCHALADAGTFGEIGPPLDHDPNLTTALIVSRVTNGQAAMPPFGDQMSGADIADLAAYIMHAAAK